MKKLLSVFLSLALVFGAFPAAFAAGSALTFTWAWEKGVVENASEAFVASWQGGSNASSRSSFIVFDMPQGFSFDELTTTVTADFTINSATLNNGTAQAPTAAIVIVDGDAVKTAYAAKDGAALAELKSNGEFVGTYKIGQNPAANPIKGIDLCPYFKAHNTAKSVGIYMTNLEADGYDCGFGIASGMTSFSLDLDIREEYYDYITAVDENEEIIDVVYIRGEAGEEFDVSDYATDAYYKDGARYILQSVSAETVTLSDSPIGVTARYVKQQGGELYFPATRTGYSGDAYGSGILVATGGGDTTGSYQRAPVVSGVSNSGSSTTLGSNRSGVMEFKIDSAIDVSTMNRAVLNFYVTGVHANLYSAWMRVGVFATDNPDLSAYTLGGMDGAKFPAANDDYSASAVYWTNEQISSSSTGWKTVDIRKIIADALDEYKRTGDTSSSVRIVLRLQVPTAGLYIAPSGGNNAPYLAVSTGSSALIAHYDFDALTDSGRAVDSTGNGYDALLLGNARLEGGYLVLDGNGAAQIDYEDFRANLDSYTIITALTLSGDAVNNTRIYDFGASSGNSGFLRTKDFALGLKYNNGATVLAAKNMGATEPFSQSGKEYHVAVTYDSFSNVSKVFIDGDKVIETTSITHGLDDFSDKTANNFIGRTNWYNTNVAADNPDIRAKYDYFSVYSEALDERVLLTMYDPDLEDDVRSAARAIESGTEELINSPVTEDLPFDAYYNDGENIYSVKWFTSDESIINSRGNVFRGAQDLDVNVYATVSLGGFSVTTSVMTVTVAALSQSELEASLILRETFDGETHARANISENNVIKLPDDINVGVTDYTVAAFVRADDLTRDGQRIYDFGVENGTVSGNYYALTKINSNGTLTVGVNNGGSTQYFTSTGAIHESEWTHVAIVYSSASGETFIYINGELDSSTTSITYTMGGAAYGGHSTSNYLGRSQWYRTQSADNPDFVGKIDNFTFYSAALSQSVIKSLCNEDYDSPPVEITSASYVNGMNCAIVNVSSHGYTGGAQVILVSYLESALDDMTADAVTLSDGKNSFVISFTKELDGVDELKCFVWGDINTLLPLTDSAVITRQYKFDYNYAYPDNHLLSNEFSLKAYDGEKYLSLANSVSMADWKDGDRNLLWTAPFDYSQNAEGYYGLKNVNGTYLALDTGSVKTDKINNWRFVRVSPEKVDGKTNVYAILQRSSGKYLARNGALLIGTFDPENENAWWVLDIVNYDTLSKAFVTPGFMSLSDNERARIYGVTSQAMWLSSNRRGKLLEYIGSDFFDCAKEEQSSRLRKIFSYVPSNQVNRSVTKATTGSTTVHELGEIASDVWYTGKDGEGIKGYRATATYYTDSSKEKVEQTVTIYGRSENSIRNIATGFTYIPHQFRKYITNIKDSYNTANQFNCGARDMYVRTSWEVSASSFAMTASHEVGHSISASWGWVCTSSRYRNAISGDLNKVSGYGNNNSTEDFAEFVQFVVSCANDPELLREISVMFPGRFNVLRAVLREQNGGTSLLDVVE